MRSRNCFPVIAALALLLAAMPLQGQTGIPYHYIFPVVTEVETEAGIPVQIPIFLENSGSSSVTLSTAITGAPEFSLDSLSQVIPLQPNMVNVALLHFVSTAQGTYSTLLTVTDGTVTDSLTLTVTVLPPPGPFVLLPPYHDIMADVSTPLQIPVTVQNLSGSALTVSLSLNGNNAFSYSGSQSTVIPASGAHTVSVDFQSANMGQFQAVLHVSDGNYADSVLINVFVAQRPFNWIVPFEDEFDAMAGMATPIPVFLQNGSPTPVNLTLAISGDPEFSLDPANTQITVDKGTDLQLSFLSTAVGTYQTLLTVTDGVKTDSLLITVHVQSGHTGGPDFTMEFDGKDVFFPFEAAAGASLTKDLTITNISSAALSVQLSLFSDSSFSISPSTLNLDSAASGTVQVTFDNNYGGYGDGMLNIESGNQMEMLFLMGYTLPWTDYDGLLVMNDLDFGMVDTSMQLCLPVMLENTTASSIAISDIKLSGFSSDFSLPNSTGFSIDAGKTETITVCFDPSVLNQVQNEVLTFTFNNPASTPQQQTATVNISGRASTGINPHLDSCGIVGWYVNTISAPIDGSAEVDIELFNISKQAITLTDATWEDGNNLGIYSLQTLLPLTIQPHDPSVPNSGKEVVTIRYAPTTQSSTVGLEDIALLRFDAGASSFPVEFWLSLVGIPIQPAPNSGTIVMFPKDGRVPTVDLSSTEISEVHSVTLENNLQVPITVTGLEMSSQQHFAFDQLQDFPVQLQPGETMAVKLRTTGIPSERSTDVLTMHGTHEHLNSRINLLSGNLVTGISQPAQRPEQFSVSVAPNPSPGPMTITLSNALRDGRVQIVDMMGRIVAEFRADATTIQWNGYTATGTRAEAGTYHVRVLGSTVDGAPALSTQRIVLLR